eukprot:5147381-Amphidinium_carterae.1
MELVVTSFILELRKQCYASDCMVFGDGLDDDGSSGYTLCASWRKCGQSSPIRNRRITTLNYSLGIFPCQIACTRG